MTHTLRHKLSHIFFAPREMRGSQRRFKASFLDKEEDLALLFCTQVLKLESLHWGYWEGDEQPTFQSLPAAQTRFSIELFHHIPQEVKTVLDIGCGLGDNARLLAQRGYGVTAISPDINQQRAFEAMGDVSIDFHRSGIEDYQSDQRFDLALMSESNHFFAMEAGFEKCRELLQPAGYILAASMFRQSDGREFGNFHVESQWVRCAAEYGFEVKERRDITEQVLPSSALIGQLHQQYVLPILDIGEKFLTRAPLLKRWVLSFLLGGQLAKLRQYLLDGFISQVSDPQLFKDKARYVVYLLQKQ